MRCLGCLQGPESTPASQILCPRCLTHLPLELTLVPKLVGDPLSLQCQPDWTSPHLLLPTFVHAPLFTLPFQDCDMVWTWLLPVKPEVSAPIPPHYVSHHFPSSHPPPSPFNWTIGLGLLLQFCLRAIRPPPKRVLLKSSRQNFIVTESVIVSDSSVFIALFTSLLYWKCKVFRMYQKAHICVWTFFAYAL